MSYELVSQNGQYLIRERRGFSGGKRSFHWLEWLLDDGTWTKDYSKAGRWNSQEEAEKHLIKVIKIYE